MHRALRPGEVMSEAVRECIEEVQGGNVRFILDPRGVTKFIVKPMGSKERFTVNIGDRHTCTCKSDDLCIHIIYILMKYFGVPKDNPILFKQPLSEYEVNLIIDGKTRGVEPQKPQEKYKTKSGKTKVKRLPIGPEDVCPVCYDNLCDCDKSKIAWCRCGCGGNFHRKCVKEWINSRRDYGEEPTCPICRTKLDMLGINPPPKKLPKDEPPNLTPEEIRELMTREISPDDYDLLLRLDQPRQTQNSTKPRPKPSNPRSAAAAAIIGNARPTREIPATPDLAVTSNNFHGEVNSTPRAVNSQQAVRSNFRPNPRGIPPRRKIEQPHFEGGITGLGMGELPEMPSNFPRKNSPQTDVRPQPMKSRVRIVERHESNLQYLQTPPDFDDDMQPRGTKRQGPRMNAFDGEINGLNLSDFSGGGSTESLPPIERPRVTRPIRPHPLPKERPKNEQRDFTDMMVTNFPRS